MLPVIHGSGDCALMVRRAMLAQRFDCLAVPLPRSFQAEVEAAIEQLPTPSVVIQAEPIQFDEDDIEGDDDPWSTNDSLDLDDDEDLDDPAFDDIDNEDLEAAELEADDFDEELEEFIDDDDLRHASYVPIDPCQPVIAALRTAMGEHMARHFIDLETARFEPHTGFAPDPYALKHVRPERFAAAMLPSLPTPPPGQPQARIAHMAERLRELELRHKNILFVCSVQDWPWIREAYRQPQPSQIHEEVQPAQTYGVEPETLFFLLGELPLITGLYERARAELENDENLSVDGIKELLIAAREHYKAEFKGRARNITPHLLRVCLKYIRNLSLIERRLTPDLYTIVTAAKQIAGDQYALHVVETAKEYPYVANQLPQTVRVGIGHITLPDGEPLQTVSRLPGVPVTWRSLELKPRPEKFEREKWQMQWNPFRQCSWPPEDEKIENFREHVFNKAKQVLGADLAKTEKFTTSVEDGIDIRETLRHWYDGEIYVRILPPNCGTLDAAVMLFDAPADPREYPWRSTWYAEHDEESTLAFYATNFLEEPVGPGICLATYGGAMFLFPPVAIPDIWSDPNLDFATTLEERLIGAACMHSRERHIALLSHLPPGVGFRKLAKRFNKRLIHVPFKQFSDSTVQQLRMVHVLNGSDVRSFAASFIRKA